MRDPIEHVATNVALICALLLAEVALICALLLTEDDKDEHEEVKE